MNTNLFELFVNLRLLKRQRSPGRGENHCFQKPRGPRLRVQRIVIPRCQLCH